MAPVAKTFRFEADVSAVGERPVGPMVTGATLVPVVVGRPDLVAALVPGPAPLEEGVPNAPLRPPMDAGTDTPTRPATPAALVAYLDLKFYVTTLCGARLYMSHKENTLRHVAI